MTSMLLRGALALLVLLSFGSGTRPAAAGDAETLEEIASFRFETLRAAMEDLVETYGDRFPAGEFLAELSTLQRDAEAATGTSGAHTPWPKGRLEQLARQLANFKRRVLLANPALDGLRILCVRRTWKQGVAPNSLVKLGIPSNHECHSSLPPLGYDNEIAVFQIAAPATTWETLHRPQDGAWIGDPDLHFSGDRVLFSMAEEQKWNLWEMAIDGGGMRQITRTPADVSCFDACYLPSGHILCASDATGQCVPCWHGVARKSVANLFVMNGDGSDMRRITFDQDHNMHPAVLSSGQVVYNRWDYTGINRVFLRPLMTMNPDGTGQRSLYGSNSWFPNGLYSMHELPGRPGQLLSILAGYHGPGRTGHLVVVDTNQGRYEAEGIVRRISGRGLPLAVEYMDEYTTEAWPKFHSCYPITGKHYLVSAWISQDSRKMGIYLADLFDNLLLVHEIEGEALVDPIPIRPRPTPPVIPEQTDGGRDDGLVYLQDLYTGPGLAGVPPGTIKRLRVIAYNFGYVGLAGNDKIGLSGPWDAMRILGTTPVEEDGSAVFWIPANTPVAFQALDEEGKAVQLMRTWLSARPGERISCVGCHEHHGTAPTGQPSLAAAIPPRALEPWYGPARGFDFAREVQPVLNRYCVGCHDGREGRCDLRPEEVVDDYRGRQPGRLDLIRLRDEHRSLDDGRIRYTPAYEALLPYIRRVNVGDDVGLLAPGYYHADTSELIQILEKGHHGVQLDAEGWDRLVTWIDLNGPCHGTWRDVFDVPMPGCADQRRKELFELYGGPPDDPEWIPPSAAYDETPVEPRELSEPEAVALPGWPPAGAARHEAAGGKEVRSLNLPGGGALSLVRIPAGRFVMGSRDGQPDESPQAPVEIKEPFWMSISEITNEQLQRYLPDHDSGHYTKRHLDRTDDRGIVLGDPSQPALKVSWKEATGFCRWLSECTGLEVSLPTEAQWEYACRAGRATPFHYGGLDDDFSPFENMADRTFATLGATGKSVTGKFEIEPGVDFLVAEGVDLADRRFDDGGCVTMPPGSRRPNAFGLCDMHGNVAEWTLSLYRPYPYDEQDGRNDLSAPGQRVVRGGSFLDRPERCRSAARYGYPAWQKVHNVGFRVVVNQSTLDSRFVIEDRATSSERKPIQHRFLALDESRKQLLFVDEGHPEKDWTLQLPRDAAPRDMQVVGGHRALVASGKGYLECDVQSGTLIRQVDCVDDMVISLRRLRNGNTLLIGRDGGNLYEVDPEGALLRTVKIPVNFARLVRFTPEGNLVFCPDSQVMEVDLEGRVVHAVPLRVQDDPRPPRRSGYQVLKKLNGNYLVSTCYATGLAEVTPSGEVVGLLGGGDHPRAKELGWFAFTGFQVLPNGNTVVTTWNGHGADDSRKGVQLMEFDSDGQIVWTWHDPDRAGSILAVVVLDTLDTSVVLEEKGDVLMAARRPTR